ncbi:PP0621 family protein [Caballeronia ptereochthonis]|uniref:Pyrimidine deaminase n=1 Tax=Caballeronia ptereochthonis TaxID=1777144 RepID=A0A158E3J9_9BURK|nr:PP0621 family protein [Caballeronia ptereochthonis]SAL01419.1 pyrimidine deaminase [Caballeronia ptereochthonis]
MRNFFFLIVLFFLSQWLLKKLRRANERVPHDASDARTAGSATAGGASGARRARNGNGAATDSAPQLADPLIRCAQCGVHTPRSESIVVAGERFCCADHARAHASRPTGRDAR